MDDERKEEQQNEEQTEESRRELLSKFLAAAGAVAVTGIAAEALTSDAEGAEVRRIQRAAPVSAARVERLPQTPLQYRNLPKGHSFEVAGTQLSQVLAREGLISKDLAGAGAVMTIKLEWS